MLKQKGRYVADQQQLNSHTGNTYKGTSFDAMKFFRYKPLQIEKSSTPEQSGVPPAQRSFARRGFLLVGAVSIFP